MCKAIGSACSQTPFQFQVAPEWNVADDNRDTDNASLDLSLPWSIALLPITVHWF